MMPVSMRMLALSWIAPFVFLHGAGHGAGSTARGSDEEEIRATRARSNAAIERHDLDGIAESFLADVTVVSSVGARTTGKAENRLAFERIFQNRPDARYRREPEDVRVLADWEVASERGRWEGSWTDKDGEIRISGTYLAQWRRVEGRWGIQAELFVPLDCRGGAYCRAHP